MASEAARGQDALKANDYPLAITHLTAALKSSQSPLWLIQRSTAYQRTGKHELALADADNAVLAARSRARRELIATAQFRRAVALHGLKRYGDARMCLNWCMKINEKEKGVTLWMARVKADYEKAEKEGGESAEKNLVMVKEIPDEIKEVGAAEKDLGKKLEETKIAAKSGNIAAAAAAVASAVATPKEKIRTEWYQSGEKVTIEILAKGVPKEQAEISIKEGSLHVSFPIASSNSTYDYTLDPLCRRVDAEKSTYRLTPHKIEIVLHKSEPSFKWQALEGTEPIAPTTSETSAAKIPEHILKSEAEKGPSYPTSSRSGPKNWDSIGDDDDNDEADALDGFFKKLYKDADPDTKRAMMKSYQESNGTALSTSWSEVGKKTVPTQPPEGLEAKKW